MKTWIPVLCAVALLAGCAGKKDPEVEVPKPAVEAPKVVVDYEKLERRDELGYFGGKPFTGVAVAKYENGQKAGETTYLNGTRTSVTEWDENGNQTSR